MPRSSPWTSALRQCADPARARHARDRLEQAAGKGTMAQLDARQAQLLATLLSGSRALGDWLIAHPEELPALLDLESLAHPRRAQGLRREVQGWLEPALDQGDSSGALERLRRFKQREMLRIAARDLGRLGPLPEIVRELSDVADVCLATVYRVVLRQFHERFGRPYHQDAAGNWAPTEFAVLGMGKLGGQELNYSSDIDLMFVYTEEGRVFRDTPAPGSEGRGLSTHQFYQRLIEALVAELTRLTPEGSLYRVDLRLRPEGDAGPLARSLAGYENYYAQWGQTWERMMLIKARAAAGDEALAAEFLELIQSYRYPRSLPERALGEIAAMKRRIETEVVRSGELHRNVKLGSGGIREIEFIVQSLQLLHAGRLPFLQNPQTLPTLGKLVQYDLLPEADAHSLTEAYQFLRDVEHRLQMEDNQQTHTIPDDPEARDRLARLMGCPHLKDFNRALLAHTQRVRQLYEQLIQAPPTDESLPLPGPFAEEEAAWKQTLTEHSFTQVDKSLAVLRTFIEGPGYVHTSPRTTEMARRLTHRFLEACPVRRADGATDWPDQPLSDPDRVLARLDSYVSAYGSRAMLYEMWAGNLPLFGLLLLLFDRSEFLAETAIRSPDLVEDLVLSGQLRRRKTAAQILEELRHGAADQDQMAWIRRYHQTEFMRLGLRDILGLADFELNLAELSGLADACLQYALEVVMRRHRLKSPPFAIIGLGKLGGAELTYGSDLDITFVADSRIRQLHRVQKLAAEVMEILSLPTEHGVVFQTDARLRPDGAKGLLVNTLKAYEDYYRKRALLWEIQSISRTRTVAGDLRVGRRFRDLASQLSDFSEPRPEITAYQPDWLRQIAQMRQRIEKERTASGQDALAIKTGRGGLIDAEFVAQALCMAQGWPEANTLKALERARDAQVLGTPDGPDLIHHYRSLHRIEGILRRWSFVGEATLPADPAPLYRVAVRCGHHDAQAFLEDVQSHREVLRRVYERVFQ